MTMKRGITQFTAYTTPDSRTDKLHMFTELFDLEGLKKQDNFVIKTYKDSFYAGQIDMVTKKRSGFGIIKYNN